MLCKACSLGAPQLTQLTHALFHPSPLLHRRVAEIEIALFFLAARRTRRGTRPVTSRVRGISLASGHQVGLPTYTSSPYCNILGTCNAIVTLNRMFRMCGYLPLASGRRPCHMSQLKAIGCSSARAFLAPTLCGRAQAIPRRCCSARMNACMPCMLADTHNAPMEPYRININKEKRPGGGGLVTGGGGLGGIGPLQSKLSRGSGDSLDIFGGMVDMHGRKKY